MKKVITLIIVAATSITASSFYKEINNIDYSSKKVIQRQNKVSVIDRNGSIINIDLEDNFIYPENTKKIRLTLDKKIQSMVENKINNGVRKYNASRGLAIIMDLESGDLLAFATNSKNNSSNNKIHNWGITDFFEPGSILKIFSIAMALEKGKLNINDVIPCPGAIKVDGWTIHDHGISPNKIRNLKPIDILKASSNVGTSIITRRISTAEHHNLLLKFGFGKTTNLGFSNETKGILPELPWAASKQSTISFGQGIAITPLQLVTAMSTIARNGIRIEPKIIKEVIDIDNNVIKEYKSNEERVLSNENAEKLKNLLVDLIKDKEGTSKNVLIPGYNIAGKTGTSDKVENGKYSGNVITSFLGFYPAKKPKILELVIIDSPQVSHFSSTTAVPVFREIAINVIKDLKIPLENKK